MTDEPLWKSKCASGKWAMPHPRTYAPWTDDELESLLFLFANLHESEPSILEVDGATDAIKARFEWAANAHGRSPSALVTAYASHSEVPEAIGTALKRLAERWLTKPSRQRVRIETSPLSAKSAPVDPAVTFADAIAELAISCYKSTHGRSPRGGNQAMVRAGFVEIVAGPYGGRNYKLTSVGNEVVARIVAGTIPIAPTRLERLKHEIWLAGCHRGRVYRDD